MPCRCSLRFLRGEPVERRCGLYVFGYGTNAVTGLLKPKSLLQHKLRQKPGMLTAQLLFVILYLPTMAYVILWP
jgi:hypothetical protein